MALQPNRGDREYEKFEALNTGETAVRTTLYGSGSSLTDAFGRLKISNPETIFDSKLLYDDLPLFWDDQEVSGGGTSSTHSTATASSTLAVSDTTAGNRTRQTFRRFNYQPGKSQLIIMTGVIGSQGTGLTAGLGLYDDDNGVFFQNDGGTLKVVVRSSTSGSAVDTKIAQSDWNGDTLDGTGSSGVTLDPDKTQIFWMDFEWLGTGTVRFGFFIDGQAIICHKVNNANTLSDVYMSTPNLPLRYELDNDGTGGASTLKQICSTVISEGGVANRGLFRHIGTENTALTAVTGGAYYALVGIRLKTTHLGATVIPIDVSLFCSNNNDIHWELRLNPTVANTFTYGDITNSAVQFALGGSTNTVTGGTELTGGYIAASGAGGNASASGGGSLINEVALGAAIDGTRDTLVLVVMPVGTGTLNATVHGDINFREQS